jgi:hypothetical protein
MVAISNEKPTREEKEIGTPVFLPQNGRVSGQTFPGVSTGRRGTGAALPYYSGPTTMEGPGGFEGRYFNAGARRNSLALTTPKHSSGGARGGKGRGRGRGRFSSISTRGPVYRTLNDRRDEQYLDMKHTEGTPNYSPGKAVYKPTRFDQTSTQESIDLTPMELEEQFSRAKETPTTDMPPRISELEAMKRQMLELQKRCDQRDEELAALKFERFKEEESKVEREREEKIKVEREREEKIEAEKVKVENDEREKLRFLEMKKEEKAIQTHKLARPDYTRTATIVKQIISKNLKLVEKHHWPDLKKHLKQLEKSEDWPTYLMDPKAPKWSPDDPESLLDSKLRKEMFAILRDSVDWKKHSSKMNSIIDNDGSQLDGQALFRKLEDFFACGKQDGDVIGAGMNLRQLSMASSNLNALDFALELERRERVLQGIGLPTNVRLELIPLYLRGLTKSFKGIKDEIERQLEEDESWNPTLREVVDRVERRAVKDNLLEIKASGKFVTQNFQDGGKNKSPKKNKSKQKNKNQESKRVQALKQEIEALKNCNQSYVAQDCDQSYVAQDTRVNQLYGSTKPGGEKICFHGAKCWLKDCKFKHASGHRPAKDPRDQTCAKCQRKGHSQAQCGKCFRCGSPDHIAPDCPKNPKSRQEGEQNTVQSYQGVQVTAPNDVMYHFNSEVKGAVTEPGTICLVPSRVSSKNSA